MTDFDRFGLIRRAGARMAEIGISAPEAEVPRYPGHTLTDLLRHTGRVHRRTTRVVKEGLLERPDADPVPDDDIPDWFTSGLLEMAATLEEADPVMSCWGFGPRPTVAFWTRRMAIETELHRWDAESATTTPAPFAPEVALDAIDELRVMSVPWSQLTEPRRPGPVVTIAPIGSDDTWTLVERDDGYELVLGSLADATLRGEPSDLFLALTGREHGPLDEAGPLEAHRHWRQIVAGMRDAAF